MSFCVAPPVILSGVAASLREAAMQSKDLWTRIPQLAAWVPTQTSRKTSAAVINSMAIGRDPSTPPVRSPANGPVSLRMTQCSLGARQICAFGRVHAYLLAFVDERRNLHHQPSLGLRRF